MEMTEDLLLLGVRIGHGITLILIHEMANNKLKADLGRGAFCIGNQRDGRAWIICKA
jgi:hypothetical protein